MVVGSGLGSEAAVARACSVNQTGAGGDVIPLRESKVFLSSSIIWCVCVVREG